jgi:hypothetical protein
LGPDASHASNKPFLTLGKVLVTGSALNPGDTVYVAPGYYYSSGGYTVLGTISSVGSPTQIIGDPTNAQGFKTAGGVLLAPGLPWITTRTSGEGIDSPIASANNMFNCNTNNPSGLQFRKLVLEVQQSAGTVVWFCKGNTGSDNTFSDCVLIAGIILQWVATDVCTAGRNFTVQRCVVFCNVMISVTTSVAAATADADLNIVFKENFIYGKFWVNGLALGTSGNNLAGGIYCYNNTNLNQGTSATGASKISTTTPIKVGGNLMFGSNGIFNAGTAGQIIDDGYNRFFNATNASAYTNVTKAGTSIEGQALNLVLPNIFTWGLEMPRADMFGWTDAAHANQKFSASGVVTADIRNRTVRPWGAGASIGCWQAQDVVQDTSSAITGGGTNSLKLTGAGEVSLYIPVDAAGFTVSVRTKSTTYGGTNYPQMCVCANPGVGVTTDTTVTAAAATEETITTATITPTSKGVMEVRLISRSTSTTSTTHFDILTSA